jgi:hypothetical protein
MPRRDLAVKNKMTMLTLRAQTHRLSIFIPFQSQRPRMKSASSFPLAHALQDTAYLKVPLLPASFSITKVFAGISITLSPERNGERVNLSVTSVPSAIRVTTEDFPGFDFESFFFRVSDLHVPLSQKK